MSPRPARKNQARTIGHYWPRSGRKKSKEEEGNERLPEFVSMLVDTVVEVSMQYSLVMRLSFAMYSIGEGRWYNTPDECTISLGSSAVLRTSPEMKSHCVTPLSFNRCRNSFHHGHWGPSTSIIVTRAAPAAAAVDTRS